MTKRDSTSTVQLVDGVGGSPHGAWGPLARVSSEETSPTTTTQLGNPPSPPQPHNKQKRGLVFTKHLLSMKDPLVWCCKSTARALCCSQRGAVWTEICSKLRPQQASHTWVTQRNTSGQTCDRGTPGATPVTEEHQGPHLCDRGTPGAPQPVATAALCVLFCRHRALCSVVWRVYCKLEQSMPPFILLMIITKSWTWTLGKMKISSYISDSYFHVFLCLYPAVHFIYFWQIFIENGCLYPVIH